MVNLMLSKRVINWSSIATRNVLTWKTVTNHGLKLPSSWRNLHNPPTWHTRQDCNKHIIGLSTILGATSGRDDFSSYLPGRFSPCLAPIGGMKKLGLSASIAKDSPDSPVLILYRPCLLVKLRIEKHNCTFI